MFKFILIFVLFTITCFADTYVNGYTKKNGTYVQGYYRSTANKTKYDNYSTKGNINPYTGKTGTKKVYDNYGNSFGSKKKKSKSYSGW